MSTTGRCGRCTATWTGEAVAHCGACHETFATARSFDDHRVGGIDNRRCEVSKTRHAINSWGYWGRAGTGRPSLAYTGDGNKG